MGAKKIPIYQLDQYHNWADTGKDGIKVDAEKHEENNVGENRFYVNKNGEQRMTERGADLGVLFNNNGDAYNLRTGQGICLFMAIGGFRIRSYTYVYYFTLNPVTERCGRLPRVSSSFHCRATSFFSPGIKLK